MKKIIIFLFFLLVTELLFGQQDSLGCTGTLGDIKYSVLDPEQFQAANGDCWILADGRGIATSKLAIFGGLLFAPDYQGIFVRGMELGGNNKHDKERTRGFIVGDFQQDARESHTHQFNATVIEDRRTSVSKKLNKIKYKRQNSIAVQIYNVPSNHSTKALSLRTLTNLRTKNTGGSENRPKNSTAYIYIRIE